MTKSRLYLPEGADSFVMVWLGVAVAAMIVSGGFLAMLNGMGRIRDGAQRISPVVLIEAPQAAWLD